MTVLFAKFVYLLVAIKIIMMNVILKTFVSSPALSLVPEFRGQNGQDGEDFQAAEEHGDTGHGFGEGGEDGVGAGGSGDAKARPDAAHGGDADAYGVDHANAVKDEEEGEEDIHHDVDEEVTGDVEEDLIRQVAAVHGDVGH